MCLPRSRIGAGPTIPSEGKFVRVTKQQMPAWWREGFACVALVGMALGLQITQPTTEPKQTESVPAVIYKADKFTDIRAIHRVSRERPRTVPKKIKKVQAVPDPKPTPKPVTSPPKPSQKPPTPTGRPGLWSGATSVWDKASDRDVRRAVCIVHHESWSAGTYKAENPSSTASGVAQWIDSTWIAHANYAGIKVVPHASNNSPEVQDRVFLWGVRHAMYAWKWNGGNCQNA